MVKYIAKYCFGEDHAISCVFESRSIDLAQSKAHNNLDTWTTDINGIATFINEKNVTIIQVEEFYDK